MIPATRKRRVSFYPNIIISFWHSQRNCYRVFRKWWSSSSIINGFCFTSLVVFVVPLCHSVNYLEHLFRARSLKARTNTRV
jgi:hypothetical protein